ncbi:NADH-quinone oxidoreductase subunit L [Bryobacterales bacterium F-183]|nr:NADH-quinone oxidoreductase subunit L [Bryobacterales bacterium F-183]
MHLWLIPILPLIGFLINGIFGKKLSKPVVNIVAIGSVLLSFAWVLKTFSGLYPLEEAHVEKYFTWISSGTFNIGFDLMIDKLNSILLLIITGVGLLIHIYATGYMAHEEGYYRFFAYLNLFMFFMLILVLGANFLLLFVGWEGVGLCSYLLIGFYFTEKFAGDAGKKAFIVNRVGDFGFALAMFLIFIQFGSLDFATAFHAAEQMPKETSCGILTGICLLLILGATGKSAQIPLYVWLPDAMAGPTPVSALIHAATMVTAGVYMVTRSHAMFNNAPIALEVLAVIGLLTAFFAATIGLAQTDIKKVFAYSTVSQLGYMFLGLGVGSYSGGVFHLMTHAFFKALLFLGAGSVIHGCHHEQEMSQMGGLMKKMPVTAITLFCAGFAIAGLPFTSGAASKDLILEAAYVHHPWMYWLGLLTAFMTAFYVFRALFWTFFGEYRGHAHPHESPISMTAPLMVLAVLSLGGGFINIPHWLESMTHEHHPHVDTLIAMLPFAAGFGGIALAYVMYVLAPGIPEQLASTFSGLYRLIYNKYFVDEAYDAAIVHPLEEGSRELLWKGVDAGIIDGVVNGAGKTSAGIGGVLRRLQSGSIRNYAAWVVAGSILVIVAIGVMGGSH